MFGGPERSSTESEMVVSAPLSQSNDERSETRSMPGTLSRSERRKIKGKSKQRDDLHDKFVIVDGEFSWEIACYSVADLRDSDRS